jgi:phosphatidate cytidylyltransferase
VLRTRLISAAIMIVIVVGGLFYLPTTGFALLLALVMAAGLWEWSRMIPLATLPAQILYPLLILVLLWQLQVAGLASAAMPLLWAGLGFWVLALLYLPRAVVATDHGLGSRIIKSLAGVLVTVPAWAALVLLHGRATDGPFVILYLLVLVWLADSGAYFAGRRWGRRKLAPVISPGKTWEGVYGAMVVCTVFAVAVGLSYGETLKQAAGLLVVSLLTLMFSIVGDLLESLMKRQAGIKDSSNLIPGHGGVLDRIDSLTAAAPFFALGVAWLNG